MRLLSQTNLFIFFYLHYFAVLDNNGYGTEFYIFYVLNQSGINVFRLSVIFVRQIFHQLSKANLIFA